MKYHLIETCNKEVKRSTCIRDLAVAPKLETWGKPACLDSSIEEVLQTLAQYFGFEDPWLDAFLVTHVSQPYLWDGPLLDQGEGDGRGANNGPCGTSQDHSYPPPGSSGNPRKQRNKRGGGDHPERQPQKRRSIASASSRGERKRRYACPYFLRDNSAYFQCLGYHLHRVGDVRQHLLRQHLQEIHCPRCGHIFKGQTNNVDRDRHLNENNCDTRVFNTPPGMTVDAVDRMREAASGSSTRDDAAKWFEIWDCIFPGIPQPISPYLDDGVTITSYLIEEYQNQPNIHVATLLSLVPPAPAMQQEAYGHICNMLAGIPPYFTHRMGGSINHSQGNEYVPRDVLPQSPINPNVHPNLSLTLPQSIIAPQDSVYNSPENQLPPIDENGGVSPYNLLTNPGWQPTSWPGSDYVPKVPDN
ncbi:uncharacterized protein F4817DRAFT_334813 [Daldinia loculata]|uniref:uncharacterized protein n=1 Tax=Daldinia loculata TaxID=103429 RepID=UPI0020C32740|nr:uncharacterized protein F4817DRAFT_334813 [Daldinia loculata]KAI1648392.1 hypothetical protein F4817DRAFT_334813 [Daldinia loculata]